MVRGDIFAIELLTNPPGCVALTLDPHERMVFNMYWIKDLKTVLDTFIAGYGPEIYKTSDDVKKRMQEIAELNRVREEQ